MYVYNTLQPQPEERAWNPSEPRESRTRVGVSDRRAQGLTFSTEIGETGVVAYQLTVADAFPLRPHTNPGFGRWSGHDAGGVTSRPRRCPRSARRRCRLRFRRWPEVVPDPGEVAGHRARVNEDMNRPHAVHPQPLAHAAETVEQATPPCLGPPASPVGLLPACNCIGAPHTRQDDRKACGAKRSRDRRLG